MTDISLKALSHEIKISVKDLIEHLSNIGIFKYENDSISKEEKNSLLKHIDKNKKFLSNTLIFKRKTRRTLNVLTVGGKNKSIQVEIRKNKTYVKNSKLDAKIFSENLESNSLMTKNNIQKKQKKQNISNNLKKSNTIKNKKFKKIIDSKINEINTQKILKENIEIHKFYQKNKTDYHLTTFLHSRESEEDNNKLLEKDKKKYHSNLKNYRNKKNNKSNYNKIKKEELKSVFIKNNNKKNKSILFHQTFKKPDFTINRDVVLGSKISVLDLSNKMATKSSEVIKTMTNMGISGRINQVLDQDTAQLIAEEMGHKVILHRENILEELIMKDRDMGNEIFINRAPIVTIMGHVDHGKTSLLDCIRSTKIVSSESGGITQNIGAYHVNTDAGSITFIDTPGHAAFTAMRSRGAKVTDIVVLVVAADDGVMPQTIEAIQHAKEANVPVIVAINKIDRLDSNIEKLKNDLMKYDIHSEEWGGENIFVCISAKTGKGIDKLLSSILLQSEILELKAVNTGMAEGVVIESFVDKGRGPIATILVQKGNLKKGDIVLCGFEYGRIKALRNENGQNIISAGPSIPVEVLGLSKAPLSGDKVTVVRNEKQAREVACYRKNKFRDKKLESQNRSSLENMFENINKNNISELKIVLKSNVQGSLEAIYEALLKLSSNEVKVKIIGSGIGGITETDASLAFSSNAIIIGFNVRADSAAKKIIESENLDLRYYSVIYDLINEVKSSIIGLLSPEYKQNIIGLARVRNVFKSPKFGFIAGCMVTEGIIKRNNPIRILRDNVVVYEGELESLRRFKEDVSEVRNGIECGIGIKNYNDLHVEDTIEVFEVKEIKRTF
ncbi:translation initiation factor IF-2 [Buchnera aphidicola (Muscaphis stroyani)]|uniref:Translation initiation factor IF-2 n=1 Tax=Buchnera aphidicola (Muscaphis stroyani) TaxID=1241869 RepID=A0A4D6Y449_9GAMM|nr:translation initiation factor IF-2 [Buchnera aphidicola]QCI24436.1 translation initiation factor IF-2 [Buchnera aphidicola (Muscaphis stroyani)]